MEGYRSCLSSHTTGEDYKEERVTCLGSVPGTCLQAPPVRLPPCRMVACEKKAFEFCSVRLLLPGGYLFDCLCRMLRAACTCSCQRILTTAGKRAPGRVRSWRGLNQHRAHTACSRLLITTYPGRHGLFCSPGAGVTG